MRLIAHSCQRTQAQKVSQNPIVGQKLSTIVLLLSAPNPSPGLSLSCPPSAYIKRVIAHPSFHNINFKQAEKMMETMDQGDVIIRPSSKGENHLTVTWKVSDGIYQHVDVREEGKENAFSLGATLWINSEVSRAWTSPFWLLSPDSNLNTSYIFVICSTTKHGNL